MKPLFLLLLLIPAVLSAAVEVAAAYPYLGAVAKAVGQDRVHVTVLGSAKYDPHFVVPKPSLIRVLNKADLLVINGGGLEIGWLPPLIRRANNARINPGAPGFCDASQVIDLIDKPAAVSRAYGDVHPEGNPHFNTDPHNIVPVAMLVARKLAQIDPEHAAFYADNLKRFRARWKAFLKTFDASMRQCRGMKVVQYHALYNYLLDRYGIVDAGTIEPLPGIAPSSRHTLQLISKMRSESISTLLQDPYHERKTARFIAAKTGARVVVLPHDLGAVPQTDSLEDFYTVIAKRLCP